MVFSETTCHFHEKKSIILFNSYFSFYFFQNLTNFDIDWFSEVRVRLGLVQYDVMGLKWACGVNFVRSTA